MPHFIAISFPSHSSLNATFELARLLARAGARVTSVYGYRNIIKSPPLDGLSYASFSDGYDDGFNVQLSNNSGKVTVERRKDGPDFLAQFGEAGARKVRELVCMCKDEGRHVTYIMYRFHMTWAADVAREMQIPSVALWVQPATVLAVYYHYFHGYDHLINKVESDPGFLVELPNLPLLALKDLPSFLLPSDPHSDLRVAFREQFKILDEKAKETKSKPRVLAKMAHSGTFERIRFAHQ